MFCSCPQVEWEEQLPLFDYAIRLPFYMIHKLPEVLERVVSTGERLSAGVAGAPDGSGFSVESLGLSGDDMFRPFFPPAYTA